MFSSHSRRRSGSSVFRPSVSLVTSTLLAFRTTSSSTKIGAATRSASAIASDGRESTVISDSPTRTWSTAKKVFSLRSFTTILLTWASSASRMFFMRSWVIGRGVAIFSSSSEIALASKIPTQIGSDRLSSSSRRMMIGMLDSGSSASPRTFISTSMRSLLDQRPAQTVWHRLGDADAHEIADADPTPAVEVDHAVASRAARQLARIAPGGAVDHHFQLASLESAVLRRPHPLGHLKDTRVAVRFHVLGELGRHGGGRCARSARIAEGEDAVEAHALDHVGRLREVLLRSEEHTSELQSHSDLVCRLLLEKKKKHTT